jgi:hypothetical protein
MGVIGLTGFGELLRLVGILFWVLVIGGLIMAVALPKTRKGKAFAMLVVGLFIAFPGRWALEEKLQHNAYEKSLREFLEICDRDVGETRPPHPFEMSHLYVYDATENVRGMWGFQIFDDYSYKPGKHISIINSLTELIPGTGKYLLKRAVIEQKTIRDFTYRGVRQEFIDTLTGEVKSSRTNYYLGSDFARGVSCLDSNWSSGFRDFVTSNVGWYVSVKPTALLHCSAF